MINSLMNAEHLVASKLAGKTEVSEKKNRPNDTFSTVNTK
jgi:hypothetical protein